MSGNGLWQVDELPFGEEYQQNGNPGLNKRRFIGKEKDIETGLLYFVARYMDAGNGRFSSPDPVGLVNVATGKINAEILYDPQRLNRYAYGLNNPYKYIDPDGEFAFLIPIAIIGGEALGGLAGHVLGATIVAGTVAWMMNEGNENTVSKDPDFVGQPDGTAVDVKSTPKGSYDQPDGGRTDVLQKDDHGAGQSHTHDPIINTNPQGRKFSNGKTKPGRSVSEKDVKNIKNGRAKKSKPKKR